MNIKQIEDEYQNMFPVLGPAILVMSNFFF